MLTHLERFERAISKEQQSTGTSTTAEREDTATQDALDREVLSFNSMKLKE